MSSSLAPPGRAHAGLHPEPKMAMWLSEIFPPTLILPVLTSWPCRRLLFSLALKVQVPFAAGSFGATGRARAVAKLARTISVICMVKVCFWKDLMDN